MLEALDHLPICLDGLGMWAPTGRSGRVESEAVEMCAPSG